MNCYCQRQLQKKFSKYSKPFCISWLRELSKGDVGKGWELEITVFLKTGKNVNINICIVLYISNVQWNLLKLSCTQILQCCCCILWLNCSISSNPWAKCQLWYIYQQQVTPFYETWVTVWRVKDSDIGRGKNQLSSCLRSRLVLPETVAKPWTVI